MNLKSNCDAAIRSRLAVALLLVGALFTLGAKWTEQPIQDFNSVAGAWKGTYIKDGKKYPVSLNIKADGSYDTATFEAPAFTPPPRTITDITAILDAQKRNNVAAQQALIARADSKSPKTSDVATLVRFYSDRGEAARKIGRIRQAISDLSKANDVDAPLSNQERSRILSKLAKAENHGGNRADAARHMRQAIELAEERPVRVVMLTTTLARWVVGMGDLPEAERLIAQAERGMNDLRPRGGLWQRRGLSMQLAVDRAKAGLFETTGRYAQAESLYRSIYERYLQARAERGADFPMSAQFLEVIQADWGRNLRRQGRVIEAEIQVRGALLFALKQTGRYAPMVAKLSADLAGIMSAQGRARDAEALARAAIEIHAKIGSAPSASFVLGARKWLATALAAQKRWREAVEQFEAMRSAMTGGSPMAEARVDTNPLYALALLKNDRAQEALTVARGAVERLRSRMGDDHYHTARARGMLAMVLVVTGARSAALDEFNRAVPILVQRSRRSDDESVTGKIKIRWRRRILESYIDLLAEVSGGAVNRELNIDAAAKTFRVADIARGQTVPRAVIASAARSSTRNPKLADLARREQDTLMQIGALSALFADAVSVATDQQNPAALDSLRNRIDELRASHAVLTEEIERRFPDYAALMNPKQATVKEARASLMSGEVLIATYVGKARSYIWVVPHRGDVVFAAVPLGRAKLHAKVAQLRQALDPEAETLGDIPTFNVKAAYELYTALLKPVKHGWKGSKSLLVVAHRALGQLPFSLLVTRRAELRNEPGALFSNYRKVPWLARTHAVTVLPSVSSLVTLRSLPAGDPKRRGYAGFGDPYFSKAQAMQAKAEGSVQVARVTTRGLTVRGLRLDRRSVPQTRTLDSAALAKLPRLPDTADEVKSIALALNADPTADVFIGARASETQVKTMDLSNRKVIAFATHGLVPGDLDGLVQPALALSSPAVTGSQEDGLLTVGEILGLKLNADWIILSACNTAAADGAGAEAVSGLGRAFFYAGARALLVSNWPVETTSAKALTTDLFKRQAKDSSLTRSQALQQAMLALIDGPGRTDAQGKTLFSYAHPIFWAPFTLVGDGG